MSSIAPAVELNSEWRRPTYGARKHSVSRADLDLPRDPRTEGREAVRREARAPRRRLRALRRRLPRRHRAERLREDDAAATLRRPCGTDRGRARDRRDARADRLHGARPARLPRAHGAREPRAV